MDVRIVGGGQNQAPIRAANVEPVGGRNAVDVILVGPSGDQSRSQASSASYGRINIGTSPTLILAANPSRVDALIQNVEAQQIGLGFDLSLTVQNAGVYLTPISSSSSGDGGNLSTNYTGPIYGIVASGDADVRYIEAVR